MLSCPDSPQLLQSYGKLTFKAPALVKALYANIVAVHCFELRCQNRSFVQLFCGTHERSVSRLCRRILFDSDVVAKRRLKTRDTFLIVVALWHRLMICG